MIYLAITLAGICVYFLLVCGIAKLISWRGYQNLDWLWRSEQERQRTARENWKRRLT